MTRRDRLLAAGLLVPFLALLLAAPTGAAQPCGRDHQSCPPGPIAMGRLFTSGFEASDSTLDGAVFGSTSYDTATVRSGSKSLKVTTSVGGASWTANGVLGTTYYIRAYLYIPTGGLPASGDVKLVRVRSGATEDGNAHVDSAGNVWLASQAGTQIGSSAPFPLDQWNRVEVRVLIASGSIDEIELRLNGEVVQASTGLAITDSVITDYIVGDGTGATAITVYFDDVAINDSNGVSQNSWPGDGHVVLLVPTADSAKGTGWVNDANGSTNFFDATDNKPPVGIADTTGSTGLHQIRNATANANSSYDATMTTYTAAGVPALSTINLVDPIVATAAPVSTSAKAGTVGVVSNPAITNISLAAGGTSGAFWSGTTAGTYATGWKISHGTLTYAPTVTLGTAPVMRITQVTSSTRIAMVCFMGMYVDYTPPGGPPGISTTLQSINRAASW